MKLKSKRSKAGFSLVELMVVVGIIGILASLGMPKLQKFMAKARQTEAKTKLTQFYTLNEMYYVDSGLYLDHTGTNLTTLGYVGKENFYAEAPEVTLADNGTTYTATIKNVKNLCPGVAKDEDTWSITQQRTLTGSENPNCK